MGLFCKKKLMLLLTSIFHPNYPCSNLCISKKPIPWKSHFPIQFIQKPNKHRFYIWSHSQKSPKHIWWHLHKGFNHGWHNHNKANLITTRINSDKDKTLRNGFFDYPEVFQSKGSVTPKDDYFIRIQFGSTIKEVSWYSDSDLDSKTKADLDQLYQLLYNMIVQKLEYKLLQPASGGYC